MGGAGKGLTRRSGGRVFVVSGPSGCGKTTLCKKVLKSEPTLVRSISATTRAPRRGERRSIDYIYIGRKEFENRIKKKDFIEHAEVFGNYYGTPKANLLRALKKGKGVLLNIDVQGAAQVKKALPEAVMIFIIPPSFEELKKRLLARRADTAAQIRKRLKIAHEEMRSIGRYDYIVVNDDLKKAVRQLSGIVKAEKSCKKKEK